MASITVAGNSITALLRKRGWLTSRAGGGTAFSTSATSLPISGVIRITPSTLKTVWNTASFRV